MGSFMEYVKMAIKNIKANRGRSILTMLGIIIGISSVIMIMSVGGGVTISMNKELNQLGGGQINVMLSDKGSQMNSYLTEEDTSMINELGGVEGTSPVSNYLVKYQAPKGEIVLNLRGGTPIMLDHMPQKLKLGNYFTVDDVTSQNPVCLITDKDAVKIFGSEDVIGMTLEAEDSKGVIVNYRIIGILKQREGGGLISYDSGQQSALVYVPWTTIDRFSSERSYDGQFYFMDIYTDKKVDSQLIVNRALKLLHNRRQVPETDHYFEIESFQDALSQINSVLTMVTTFVAFVAAISLFVGGIGVMNIMLVSVTERTREIGIRKSLGAKTSSIMTQFLAESAILTALGGIIGIVIGILGAFGISQIAGSAMKLDVAPQINPVTLLAVVAFSSAVGIFFGLYPAKKAARMNPIEALRRE